MKKPIIAITSSMDLNPDRLNDNRALVSLDYSNSVINSGGIPIILPITDNLEVIKEQAKYFDGLILSGGGDPDPNLYGEDCLQELGNVTPERDTFELTILDVFLKAKKPILGICRGLQLMNVFYGGTLYQDIKYLNTSIQHRQRWLADLPTHDVNILEEDNILFEIFGAKTRTNSFHHQMIKDLGSELTTIATANDGVVEAIQNKNHPFFYGVQWHPEMMASRGNLEMKKIFDKFIKSCNK
ncbi:gamma-glutamyl-gamma-aminobutyrate hydrolase family protein [Leptotrichia sp. oral taxon 847]|uniref:gamma-glutamyl-gamma-aminobutyrate hydrolase family protein n=1 Tax=Leptotrichia sp. oral taxon 847 TaxID=1785996 RepID=UPI0007680647|nr:gamma-glutamyl-gamma-aminobutyrate hydrolase family protein [Leptotrichia sp. oral taxon 847]AMD94536.1 anthranilate synthase [Leptotrichia sp. oral taxon 847]